MRVALRMALGVAMLSACEPRVEEPVPTLPAPTQSAAPESAAPSATEQQTQSVVKAGPPRCIKPTPPEPERPLVTGADPGCPEDPTGPPPLARGKVLFEQADLSVDVEIAQEDAHRQRGLMYRKAMPPDEGMLFVFEQRRVHSFWMKNTCISLDMMFIDQDGTIVGIQENVPTLDTSSFRVGCPSTYVLEVNAGWSRRNGVKAGQKVRFEGLTP